MDPNKTLNPHPYKWLMEFKAIDFSNETKAKILDELKKKPNKEFIKICGVADIKEAVPLLKEMLIDEITYRTDPNQHTQWYFTAGWAARLARARMGVKEDIEQCIKLVETEKYRGIGALNLLHDIGYIRQPEAIDYLKTYLFSDETIGQVKPTAPGELVASYVINIIADSLEDFPLKTRDWRGYKKEKIELVRKWMSEQTEWKIVR